MRPRLKALAHLNSISIHISASTRSGQTNRPPPNPTPIEGGISAGSLEPIVFPESGLSPAAFWFKRTAKLYFSRRGKIPRGGGCFLFVCFGFSQKNMGSRFTLQVSATGWRSELLCLIHFFFSSLIKADAVEESFLSGFNGTTMRLAQNHFAIENYGLQTAVTPCSPDSEHFYLFGCPWAVLPIY